MPKSTSPSTKPLKGEVNVTDAESQRPSESKFAKFERIANRRVNAALKQIQLVGNLSNRGSYAYTDEQVARVLAALEQAVASAGERFVAQAATRDDFRL